MDKESRRLQRLEEAMAARHKQSVRHDPAHRIRVLLSDREACGLIGDLAWARAESDGEREAELLQRLTQRCALLRLPVPFSV
jgi:hypothetical protein